MKLRAVAIGIAGGDRPAIKTIRTATLQADYSPVGNMTNMLLKTSIALAAIALSTCSSFAQQSESNKRGQNNGTRQTTGNRPNTPMTGTPRSQVVAVTPTPKPVSVTPAPRPVVVSPSPSPVIEQPRWGLGARTLGIDRRQADQAREIERGHRNGSLTDREYNALKAEQARISELERRAKADGVVTEQERRQLRAAQQAADRHIIQEEMNDERAARSRHHGGWRGWC